MTNVCPVCGETRQDETYVKDEDQTRPYPELCPECYEAGRQSYRELTVSTNVRP